MLSAPVHTHTVQTHILAVYSVRPYGLQLQCCSDKISSVLPADWVKGGRSDLAVLAESISLEAG